MPDFSNLIDLASERLGGAVLFANDDFFAPKENLLKAAAPVFVEGKYTERGKWMDGWESRRRRTPGFDWCLIRLGLAGRVRGVVVDTSFFRGNYPESCSLEACALDGLPDLEQLLGPAVEWTEILPPSPLRGEKIYERGQFSESPAGQLLKREGVQQSWDEFDDADSFED